MAIIKNLQKCGDCTCRHFSFSTLSKEELNTLNESRLEVVYNEGETIFKQGTSLTHIMSITRGLVKVYIEGVAKKNLILQYVGEGEFLGGPGAFVDRIHHFSVVAVEETHACLIAVDVFKKLIEQNSKFAMKYLEDVSRKGIYNFDRFISLTQKQMHGRVADALLYFENIVYPNNKEGFLLNRKDLAELTALSKDSAGRILNSFEESEIIKVVENKIVILNKAQLEQISIKG